MELHQTYPLWGMEDPFSAISHLFGAVLALVGGIVLIYRGRGNLLRQFSLGLYTFALVFLFSMSGVYHLLDIDITGREVLKRLDHAAIWVMIAGTYTPIHIVKLRGFWRWGMLFVIWAIAITGLVLKTIFFYSIPEWASVGMYLTLGWLGFFTSWKVYQIYGWNRVKYIIYGGLAYTAGAVAELLRGPVVSPGFIGPHEVFHVFVLLGAGFHWYCVYLSSGLPVKSTLTIIVRERPDSFYAYAKGESLHIVADSLPELYDEIKKQVEEMFYPGVRPDRVHLEFYKEDFIDFTTSDREEITLS